jgi:hypothetical protein
MHMQLRLRTALLTLLASTALLTTNALAQMITGFEAPEYEAGTLQLQGDWNGGAFWPHVATAAQIEAELLDAGLNVGQPVHSGDQALMVTKPSTTTETTGYFVRNIFIGLETETKVTVDYWARPLTSGLGADPAGTPAGNGKIIGERQGNTFVGIMDEVEQRAAAVRFGIVVEPGNPNPYTNAQVRTIDWASASTGNINAPWVPSGQTWQADAWYNFRFDLDYETKKYDFFINDTKINAEPIRFYNELSVNATRFFISRGTNQAGQIIDDISVDVTPEIPVIPGDFDEDGDVDGRDFLVWQRGDSPDPLSAGDLADWQENYGTAGLGAFAAVPEPGTAIMCLAMAASLVSLRQRGR